MAPRSEGFGTVTVIYHIMPDDFASESRGPTPVAGKCWAG